MRFCSPRCRKNNYSRADRQKNPRNSRYSPTKWRENYEIFDRNRALVETVYREKNAEKRNKIIEQIIALAENGNAQLRSMLINPLFLYADKKNSLLFCPGYESVGTIAQVANRYSWTTWGCSIVDVLTTKNY